MYKIKSLDQISTTYSVHLKLATFYNLLCPQLKPPAYLLYVLYTYMYVAGLDVHFCTTLSIKWIFKVLGKSQAPLSHNVFFQQKMVIGKTPKGAFLYAYLAFDMVSYIHT